MSAKFIIDFFENYVIFEDCVGQRMLDLPFGDPVAIEV